MKLRLTVLAILVLLVLLIKFGVPERTAPSPSPTPAEEPADPVPAPVEAEPPVTEPAVATKSEKNEIRAGILETGRTGEHNRTSYRAPKWARPREPIKGRGYGLFGGRGDTMMTGWDPRPSSLAGGRGFDLGLHRESTRFLDRPMKPQVLQPKP